MGEKNNSIVLFQSAVSSHAATPLVMSMKEINGRQLEDKMEYKSKTLKSVLCLFIFSFYQLVDCNTAMCD